MAERRRRGAFCLVAEMEGEPAGSEMGLVQDRVLGTLECSKHEFIGTALDPGDTISRIYLTEVAVREDCRRMGIGTYLLNFVDDVALKLGASEVYSHDALCFGSRRSLWQLVFHGNSHFGGV
ncbi:unnamed protein product [Choristocarpus tenellus]